MEFPIYVKIINYCNCEISCEGFETMEEVRAYIVKRILDILEPGDSIIIEEGY